jgi:hypothetical protein
MQFSISPGFRTADGPGAGFASRRKALMTATGKVARFFIAVRIFFSNFAVG